MGILVDEVINLLKKLSCQVDYILGESGLFVIGFILYFFSDFYGLVNCMVVKYGLVFCYCVVMQDVIIFIGFDVNEFILWDVECNFFSKKVWDIILEKFFFNGLMLCDFENYKVYCKIL